MGPAVGSAGEHFGKIGGKFAFLEKNKKKRASMACAPGMTRSASAARQDCVMTKFSAVHALRKPFFFSKPGVTNWVLGP